jgi:hypothetical protein
MFTYKRIAEPCEFGGIDGYHYEILEHKAGKSSHIADVYSPKQAKRIVELLNDRGLVRPS